MLCVSKYVRNVLITTNLSYKIPNISENDKINVIKNKYFSFYNFFCAM